MSTFVGQSVCLWKKSQNGGLVIMYQGARQSYNVHRKIRQGRGRGGGKRGEGGRGGGERG